MAEKPRIERSRPGPAGAFTSLLLLASVAGAEPLPSGTDAPFGVRAGVINDNYTGSTEAGESGRYVGSDDFLSVSYLVRAHRGDWRGGLVFNTVTSRRFAFRYDLLQATAQRTFRVGRFELHPGVGVLAKGAFGGDAIQNAFHRFRALPEVHLPYRGSGAALIGLLEGDWPRRSLLFENDLFTLTAALRLVSHHVPSRFSVRASYLARWGRFEAEGLVGYRQYLNDQPGYSELVRSGPIGGVNLRLRLVSQLFFELGVWAIAVRNLESDRTYVQRDPSYSPQISMVVSWRAAGRGLRELMEY